MEINTNINVTERESKFYKRLQKLSVNEELLSQGDGVIRISPFDDYFLFTLFDDINGDASPIDLSNVGNIYISFIGEKDEIRIKNFTNVDEINASQGEVLFRISKDESKRILNLDNRNFYISSKMIAENDSESDESVIYTGKFLTIVESAKESLTSQLDTLRIEYSKELASLEKRIEQLTTDNNNLNQTINDLNTTITALKNNNNELSNELNNLVDESTSINLKELQDKAKNVQSLADSTKTQVAQIQSNQNRVKSPNLNSPKSYIRAAKSNQNFFI